MSTTISLACGAPVLAELVAGIAIEELRHDVAAEGQIAEGIHRFHLDGRSTRFTEVTVGAESFEVRMFSMASPEDIDLALRIVEQTARLMNVHEADAEGAGVQAVAGLREIFGASWAESQAQSGVRVVRALIEEGRGPIEMPGPVRPFCVGPRVLAEVTGADEHVRMLDAIRAVQWLRVRTAGMFVAGEKKTRLAVWLGDEVVFPPVAYAALSLEQETVLIEAKHVPVLAGAHWRQLDEVQGHISELGAEEWRAVVEAARAFATKIRD